jgi:DNA-binding transcriptional ArsR family regulator
VCFQTRRGTISGVRILFDPSTSVAIYCQPTGRLRETKDSTSDTRGVASNSRESNLRESAFPFDQNSYCVILSRMANYSRASLDAVFSALSDATRRGMLERLSRGEASVTELAEPFGVSLPTIHKHLRVLERAGFIRHEKRGRVRHIRLTQLSGRKCVGRQRIAPTPIYRAKNWITHLEARWDEHLLRLKQQVESDL